MDGMPIVNRLQELFGENDCHELVIKCLTQRTRTGVAIEKRCLNSYTKPVAYTYKYSICWFRAICQILFFDQRFRDLLRSRNVDLKKQNKVMKLHGHINFHDDIIMKLDEFIKRVIEFIEKRSSPSNHELDLSLTVWDCKYTENKIWIEDIWIYLMYLMSYVENYDPLPPQKKGLASLFRIKPKITPQPTPQPTPKKMHVKNIIPYTRFDYATIILFTLIPYMYDITYHYFSIPPDKAKLVCDQIHIWKNVNPCAKSEAVVKHPDYLITFDTNRKLPIYIQCKKKWYIIQCIQMGLFKNEKEIGHVNALFGCRNRYHSTESYNYQHHNIIDDVNLIENMICNDGNISSSHDTFNVHEHSDYAIYKPTYGAFTPVELEYMIELTQLLKQKTVDHNYNKDQVARCIAIMSYFLKQITFTVQKTTDNIQIEIQKTENNVLVFTKRSLSQSISTESTTINKKDDVIPSDRCNSFIIETFDKVKYQLTQVESIKFIRALLAPTTYSLKIQRFNSTFISTEHRYEKEVKNIFKILLPDQTQGGGETKQYITYNKSRYVVKVDRNKEKYIVVKHQKILLKSIQRKYRYCKY